MARDDQEELRNSPRKDLAGSMFSSLPRRGLARQVAQVMLLVMLLMCAYQMLKYLMIPHLNLITSNVITVIFSTLVAGWASFVIIKRQHQLTHRLSLEVERREFVEQQLLCAKGHLEQQVAERTESLAQTNRLLTREVAEQEKKEAELKALNRDLQAKTRELSVLYDICRRRPTPRSAEEIIADTAEILPAAWDRGLESGVCITYGNRVYASQGFSPDLVAVSMPVPLPDQPECLIEVSFSSGQGQELPSFFVNQHQELLRSVADFLSKAIERKVSQADKAKLQAAMRQAQKMDALGALAGGIAHDFNNILGIILGCTERALLQSQRESDNKEELDRIMLAADQARNLVRQILDFSRDDKSNLRPLDLNSILLRFLDIMERTLPKMITIESRLAPGLALVNADANQLEQVFLNLATNAADAMPEGGRLCFATKNVTPTEDPGLRLLGLKPEPYVRLSVSDTGQGIDNHTQEHIFEPFFTTKPAGKGTGLGLAVVYNVVKGHQGQIQCQSEPGKGATFQIYFPACQNAMPEMVAESTPLEAQMRGSERVLLVDDEEILREIGAYAFNNMGYLVQTASSGEEALAIIKTSEEKFDLVVTDLGMPGMGGYRFLQELFLLDYGARVIVASGYDASGQLISLLESGSVVFLPKPFRRADLLSTARQLLDQVA